MCVCDTCVCTHACKYTYTLYVWLHACACMWCVHVCVCVCVYMSCVHANMCMTDLSVSKLLCVASKFINTNTYKKLCNLNV